MKLWRANNARSELFADCVVLVDLLPSFELDDNVALRAETRKYCVNKQVYCACTRVRGCVWDSEERPCTHSSAQFSVGREEMVAPQMQHAFSKLTIAARGDDERQCYLVAPDSDSMQSCLFVRAFLSMLHTHCKRTLAQNCVH